jgi:hypothetical protein
MQQVSENVEHTRRQDEVLAHSTSYQALQMEKIGEKLQYYKVIEKIGQWCLPIPVKLLSPLRQRCS